MKKFSAWQSVLDSHEFASLCSSVLVEGIFEKTSPRRVVYHPTSQQNNVVEAWQNYDFHQVLQIQLNPQTLLKNHRFKLNAS